MKPLKEMNREELVLFLKQAEESYQACKAKGLKLDMSRGKPGSTQVDLSNALFELPADGCYKMDGLDVRNYGTLEGLPSCRRYFAELLGTSADEVFVGGNASLTLMYDVISKAYTHGLLHSKKRWSELDKVKFLCPVPGYDRHFNICKTFGMEMIPIPMTADGPDMTFVESYVTDPDVRGMWCVPKYSNPDGIIYSDEVIRAIAALRPAAEDFLLMWDNAYCVHEFDGEYVPFPDMLAICREAGNPDMVYEFASTSKITFPGGGVSCFATSTDNMAYMKKLIAMQSISYDKVNQFRHVLFLKDKAHTLEHMKKHAAFLKPKFDVVLNALDEKIAPLGAATWHKPKGGYFVSFNAPGCAKRTNQLVREAGVNMTGAGATYPLGVDPLDQNLRIAPSYPPLDELKAAMEVFCASFALAAAEHEIASRKEA